MTNDEYDKVELFKLNQLRRKIERAHGDLQTGNTHDGEALLQSLCDGKGDIDQSNWV